MSPEKFDMVMPTFFKWKLAQRSSSSSGLSFINSSRLSPSSSNAAMAAHRKTSITLICGGGMIGECIFLYERDCLHMLIQVYNFCSIFVLTVLRVIASFEVCLCGFYIHRQARLCVCVCARLYIPSLRLSSMSANSPILIICQRSPSTR